MMPNSLPFANHWSDPMVILTIVICLAAMGSFACSLAMWCLTRTYANSYYRPHVGITHVHITDNEQAKDFAFAVEFRNVGTCPAKNVTSDWTVLVNGFSIQLAPHVPVPNQKGIVFPQRSEEHTSELQSRLHLVCRLLLEKKKQKTIN